VNPHGLDRDRARPDVRDTAGAAAVTSAPGRAGVKSPGALSRRGFLGATGAAGSAAAVTSVLGTAPASASAGQALSQEREMVLLVARAGAVFPFRLPMPGQVAGGKASATLKRMRAAQASRPLALGPALPLLEYVPATTARLTAAERRMPADRLSLAWTGAGALISAGLLRARPPALLEGIGHDAALASPHQTAALQAVVTLAIATVFPGFDPTSEHAARRWVGLLRFMYQRGTLRPALARRGIR
jgi:hypothetical protein